MDPKQIPITISTFPGKRLLGQLNVLDIEQATELIIDLQQQEPDELEEAGYLYDASGSVSDDVAPLAFLSEEAHQAVLNKYPELFETL